MKLQELLSGLNVKCNADADICGISADSRNVGKGFLFAALDNGVNDGAQYTESAIANGAAAILCKNAVWADKYPEVIFIESANTNFDFAKIAARYYRLQPKHMAAVTGTNGKTSIADFVRQVLVAMGQNAASIGTLGLIKNDNPPVAYVNTTPGVITIHKDLQHLAEEGFDYAVMEASSHGICQYRIGGVDFEAAGFTNLSRDHLDYHKTMENYYAAKKLLFTDILRKGGTAVLNADIDIFDDLSKACTDTGKKVLSYGRNGKDIRLLDIHPTGNGQILNIEIFGQAKEIFIPLAGEFQAMNVLCALGLIIALTGKTEEACALIQKVKGAKGRLEFAGQTKNGASVFVDYAHTPDALENVINAMRRHCRGRLHVLFGCGGDRDAGKRPLMGKIASELADVVYVTDDNPRTENAAAIREQIMAAAPKAYNIGDRKEAICRATANLKSGDILIVAGKGHETGQYINGKIYPFSDQEVIAECLAAEKQR